MIRTKTCISTLNHGEQYVEKHRLRTPISFDSQQDASFFFVQIYDIINHFYAGPT